MDQEILNLIISRLYDTFNYIDSSLEKIPEYNKEARSNVVSASLKISEAVKHIEKALFYLIQYEIENED